jgi:hypothetical protein
MGDVKRIDVREFREFGYLQEVNRLMLHPLGLALEVVVESCPNCDEGVVSATGTERGPEGEPIPVPEEERCPTCGGAGDLVRLGGVWDYRDDPEGIVYAGDLTPDQEKIDRVAAELDRHRPARERLLGEGRFIQTPSDRLPAE